MSVQFTVDGIAAPQGSKTPWGTEANPRTRPWRAAVTAVAAFEMTDTPMMAGAIHLDIVFNFPRPKSHYRTGRFANFPKDSAPNRHTSKPDIDKLARAVSDALTGIVYRDDSQVCRLTLAKLYAEKASTLIFVQELSA